MRSSGRPPAAAPPEPGAEPDSEAPTAIVAALPEEALPLLARLSDRRPARRPRHRPSGDRPWVVRGRLGDREAVVVVTGDGEWNAREGLRTALRGLRPGRVLIAGVAGGLAPDLSAGSLVAGRRVVDGAGRALEPDQALARAVASGGARWGVVATVSRILDSPESKAELRRSGPAGRGRRERGTGPGASDRPGAADPPDVADLESAVYAIEAERASLPWAVLRAVSDAADEGLPSYLEGCRDAGGAIRRGAVARRAMLRPWTIPALLSLRRRVREAAVGLAAAVEAAVARTPAAATAAPGPAPGTR